MSRSLMTAALVGGLCFAAGHYVAACRSTVDRAAAAHRPPADDEAPQAEPATGAFEWRRSGSDLVRPLMGCAPRTGRAIETLRAPIEAVIARAVADGRASHVGVYVHDLTTGQWLGVNPDSLFVPASVGKVPMLMALLRVEEDVDGTLSNPVDYPEWLRENDRQGIRPASGVRPGQTWTLGQLAEAMIVESDNNATFLVQGQLDRRMVEQVYRDLGWEERHVVIDGIEQIATSPRIIGGMFYALYNATYLGEGTSDLALRLLSRVRMKEGLVAGVPADVTVAHKFGEWYSRTPDGSGVGQFHDCGIVYRPGRPYVACVMTRGGSLFQRPLIELVAEISRALWSGFEALPPAG